MNQGPVLDDAGNTSVYHSDLSGTLVVGPADSELIFSPPKQPQAGSFSVFPVEYRGSRNREALAVMGFNGERTIDITDSAIQHGWLGSLNPYRFRVIYKIATKRLKSTVLEIDTSLWIATTSTSSDQIRMSEGTVTITSEDASFCGRVETHQVSTWSYTTTYHGSGKVATNSNQDENEFSSSLSTYIVHGLPCSFVISGRLPTMAQFWIKELRQLPRHREMFSQLCQEAIVSRNLWDNNMLAMIKDLKDLDSSIRGIAETGKSLVRAVQDKNVNDAVHETANMYLSNKYGYGLTIADAWSIGETLTRLKDYYADMRKSHIKLRSRKTATYATSGIPWSVSWSYAARVAWPNNAAMRAIKQLMDWDLYPTLANMWDFVPYSFVADWILDFGGLFETIDADIQKQYWTLQSSIKSIKAETSAVSPPLLFGSNCTGSITLSYYQRWILHEWETLLPSLDAGGGLNGHFAEGTALLIQRV